MNIFKIKTKNFYYEHLLDSSKNVNLIKKFEVSYSSGKGLENYLKKESIKDEKNGYNRTYLIKDKKSNKLVAYFSLRNGLFTLGNRRNRITIPSIELSNFAVNSCYREKHPETKYLGQVVFDEFIMPTVRRISDFTAINALYIYALPEDRLINHYKTLGFNRLEKKDEKFVHSHVKPGYDDGCIFMYQIL